MADVLSLIGILGVAVINVWGISIQTKSKEKTENIDAKITNIRKEFVEITNGFKNELGEFKKESIKSDEEIKENIKKGKYYMLKAWLTNELTKIKNGSYIPNEEQKRLLKEAKKIYNDVDGNSYVNDMYDECKSKGLL